MHASYSINGTPLRTNYLDLPANSLLSERARALRKARNFPEVLFWMHVNKKQFHGLDFDRQRIIGNYIVDFYVKALALIIEIDGDSHDGKEAQDDERERWLKSMGCKIIRFPAYMVTNATGQVLFNLEKFILENYS
jgi:very-short-patch-repair endonuclease